MDKRTILAMILIIIIYWFSSQYLWKPAPRLQETSVETEQNEIIVKNNVTQAHEHLSTLLECELTLPQEPEIEINDKIFMQNEKVLITFSNQGGVINQILLKDFVLSDGNTPVTLIPDNKAILYTEFSNNSEISNMIYKYELHPDGNQLTFYNSNIKRIFSIDDGYNLEFYFEGKIDPVDYYKISLNSGINLTEDNKASRKAIGSTFKFIGSIDRKIESRTVDKLKKGDQSFSGNISWVAVRSKYFVMSLIPMSGKTQSVNVTRVSDTLGLELTVKDIRKIQDFSDRYFLYLGPVEYDLLKTYNNELEQIAELGWSWLRWLAKIFRWFIGLLHSFIPNYGIVIIIFSLILKVVLTPLTNKSMNSARKMQAIQPLMRDLQNKYKNDPRTMQVELGKLYKEHKVSPLGGCLPLLLQMPIFFALYPVLSSSIEFRQASFFSWLSDLSLPDPYWILPITMGVFMFVQQKMMQPPKQDTSNMDEKQAAMMQSQKMMQYIMPPFLVFIFSGLPSGLVLYWTTFNIFSIIQQYYSNKKQKEAR